MVCNLINVVENSSLSSFFIFLIITFIHDIFLLKQRDQTIVIATL